MNNRFPKILVIIAVCLLVPAILVGGAFACQHFFDPFDNRIVEGVTVGGLDVGGMTRGEAREALSAAALETVLVEDLTVSLPNAADAALAIIDSGVPEAANKFNGTHP